MEKSRRYYFLSDYDTHTNCTKQLNRLDIIVKDIKEPQCYLIVVTLSSDKNISAKEFDKPSKYKDLEIDIVRMRLLNTTTIPVVIETLGKIKKNPDTHNFFF